MMHANHQADGEPFKPDDDKEHHQPSVPPGWIDHPAEMLENVYNLPSSDQYFASEETNKYQWCLQLISHIVPFNISFSLNLIQRYFLHNFICKCPMHNS